MKKNLSLIAAVGCLLALFEMPDEFYKILRFAVVAACCFIIFEIQKSTATDKSKSWRSIGFGLLAVVFNPILPLDMHERDWVWFNIAGAFIFGWVVFQDKIKSTYPKVIRKISEVKNFKFKLKLNTKINLILLLICAASFFATIQLSKVSKDAAAIAGIFFILAFVLLSISLIINTEIADLERRDNERGMKEFRQKLKRISMCASIEEQERLMKNWGDKWK